MNAIEAYHDIFGQYDDVDYLTEIPELRQALESLPKDQDYRIHCEEDDDWEEVQERYEEIKSTKVEWNHPDGYGGAAKLAGVEGMSIYMNGCEGLGPFEFYVLPALG